MYESPLIKMHQQIKKREGNSYLSMLIMASTSIWKKGGKVKSEHAHKRHQHLKKRGKVMSEHAHKAPASEKKRERGMSRHAHKRHQRLVESKERFKICTKHVHYCNKKQKKQKKLILNYFSNWIY